MICFDVDSGDEGERKKDGGGCFQSKTRDLKKGISEKGRPSARVGEDVCPQGFIWRREGLVRDFVKEETHTVNPGPAKDP
jgi:hypothetical protein